MQSLVALSLVAAVRTATASELLFGDTVPEFSVPAVGSAGELAGVHFAAAAVVANAFNPNGEACSTAVDVVTYCYDVLPTAAPAIEQANCFCCYDEGTTTDFLGPVYTSCESYIATAAATNTVAASVMSVVESFCNSVSNVGFSCETATSSSSAAAASITAATAATDSTAEPAGCTAFGSLYNSCSSATRGFTALNDADAASCLCYKNGRYTTALDDYISQCGVWISTASPDDYETYVALATYCEEYAPSVTSVVATFSDNIATFGADLTSTESASAAASATVGTVSASAAASASTTTPKTVTVTPTATSSAAVNAAGRVAQGGFAVWLAVILPFVL